MRTDLALLLVASLTLTATAQAASPAQALPFIEDDYALALAQARTRQVPLFVDVWAPW